MLLGGQSPKTSNMFYSYDFRLQKWESLKPMHMKRSRAGCVLHKDMIFLIGGYNGQCRTRSVDIYNPKTNEWISGVGLNIRRDTLGVGYLKNKIYAIGGYDGNIGLMSCEVFDTETETWSMIANMSMRRSSVGVATLGGYLFASKWYISINLNINIHNNLLLKN